MAFNLPSYNTNNFSFGPGILYIGPSGTTPSIDIGGVRPGMELRVTRELLEVYQGSPRTKVKQYVLSENAELQVTGIEWNLVNLPFIIGAGDTAWNAVIETFSFGGSPSVQEVSLAFSHKTPTSQTIWLYIWKAQSTGEMTLNFGDDVHEFPAVWRALVATQSWANVALSDTQQLFRIQRQKS